MIAWLRMIGWVFFAGIFFFSMRRPRLLRLGMGFFRRWAPIFASPFASFAGATYLVTRADDTQEVLDRTNDFLLGPVNQYKILTGDFIIALDPELRYIEEKGAVCRALPPARLRMLEEIVDRESVGLLAGGPDQPLDVARYAEFITVAIIRDFWGLDPAGATSRVVDAQPGCDTMRLWVRKLAIVLGSMEPGPFGIREVGVQCSEEFLSFVEARCAVHPRNANDMMAHILRESGSAEVTIRNIAGLVMTGAAVVTKAFCHAVDKLLREDEARDEACRAAASCVELAAAGNARGSLAERARVGHLLVEALRFNPVFPVLPRYCVRTTTLARGTPRQTEIPAGANVIVSPLGAMFDPEAVADAERFGFGRNLQFNSRSATQDWNYGTFPADGGPGDYVIFGGGEHWCLGDQMAVAEMASMGVALLNRLHAPLAGSQARTPYVARGLRYDGSAVASLLVDSR